MTVNRVCGSGAQAIVSAAHEILMGSLDAAIAGGMENMDAAPYVVARGRWGHRMGDGVLYDSVLRATHSTMCSRINTRVGIPKIWSRSSRLVASSKTNGLRSHKRFSAAQTAGKFTDEIVEVEVPGRRGPSTFKADEHNRPDVTIEALAKLNPVFRDGGTITAGNAPGLNTAAAAMVLAHEA
jgi:acetyl-CoA C-acetyltransferase